jgi:hypothetical protein
MFVQSQFSNLLENQLSTDATDNWEPSQEDSEAPDGQGFWLEYPYYE